MVSIVTLYYNRANHVTESIQSLLDQSYRDIEIIAIDDGSSDDTFDRLMSFKDPRLKVITQKNMGFVKSIIKAVELASGEFIAIHGSGDISYETRIEKQLELIQSRPEIGVVGCYVENKMETTGSAFVNKPYIDPGLDLTNQIIKENAFTHGEVMFRKAVYTQAGGYREFFKFCQDYDLWLRMSLITRFAIVPEILYRRYVLADGVSASLEKLMMQKYFVEIGIQCVELRRRNKPDLIDKYGIYGPFFRVRTKRFAKTMWRLALTAFYRGQKTDALLINRKSIEEKRGFYNVCFQAFLVVMNRSKLMQRMAEKGLAVMKARKGRQAAELNNEPQKQTA